MLQQITMMEMNGRWGAYNSDGSYHQCLGLSKKQESAAITEVKQKPLAVEERLARLEKAVFRDSEGR